MKQEIGAYRHITSTPEFREMERLRTKARHDEATDSLAWVAHMNALRHSAEESILEELVYEQVPLRSILSLTADDKCYSSAVFNSVKSFS